MARQQAQRRRRIPVRRRVKESTFRIYRGKEVKPVLYSMIKENGGRTNKMCGLISGEVVRDAQGNPLSYNAIPNER